MRGYTEYSFTTLQTLQRTLDMLAINQLDGFGAGDRATVVATTSQCSAGVAGVGRLSRASQSGAD